jgi:hypothetical protein
MKGQLILFLISTLAGQTPDEPGLYEAVADLKVLQKGRATNGDLIETRVAQLAKRFSDPNDLGYLYYHVAILYAQVGVYPERVMSYADKALALRSDLAERAILYVYKGDARRVLKDELPFRERRKNSLQIYLIGLKELEQADLSAEVGVELPLGRIDIDPRDPDYKKIMEERKRIHQHNQKVARQRDWLKHKQVLTRQIVDMYSKSPNMLEELKSEGSRFLRSQEHLQQMVSEATSRLERKPRELSPPPAGPTHHRPPALFAAP